MKTITVLIPAYNEEAVLPQLFARLKDLQKTIKKYRLELLFINDGSSDDTLTMIQREAKKNSSIAYVNLSRNFGKEAGMLLPCGKNAAYVLQFSMTLDESGFTVKNGNTQ